MLGLWSADYRLLAPATSVPPGAGPLGLSPDRLLAATVSLAVFAALWLLLAHTRWGVALRATGRDAETAALMGIDTDRLGALTSAAAGALAGGVGVLLATFHYLHPAGGVEVTLLAVTLAILAGASDGVGRLPGVLPAGLLVGLAESLAVAWAGPRWRELVVVALLLAVLVVRAPRPGGDRAHA